MQPGQAEADAVLADVEPILPLAARHSAWTNEQRQPHPEVFRALAEAGLLRLLAPAAYGGRSVGPRAFLAFVEALSEVDGSVGWTAMTVNEEVGIACSYLPASSMTELLATEPDVVVAGSGLALGRARPVEGGWVVDGRWGFISGGPVADRLILASRVVDDRGGSDGVIRGARRVCFTLVPIGEATLDDTWHTAGLRGTGSHDMVLDEVFVPHRWAGTFSIEDRPIPPEPYYRLSSGLRFCWPKVGVATGIARAALGEFAELAAAKRPSHLPGLLAERPNAQAAMARAEALVASGRAWVEDVQEEIWVAAARPERIDRRLHARSRLAAAHAVHSAVEAVEGLASAAGTTAGKLDGPWPRLLADVRAVGQHFTVGPHQMQSAGQVLLGQDPDDPVF